MSEKVDPAAKRILALGDSYTIGESVPPAERWPVQLAGLLRAKGIAVAEPQIVARTGWTARELMAAMDDEKFAPAYDLVTVLAGVNDEYRGGTPEKFRGDFRELLGRAVKLAGGKGSRVVVVSIPDWGVTPFGQNSRRPGVSAEIDAFNAVCHEEATSVGAAWVEITAESRKVPDHPDLVAPDGLHPSGKMYASWAAAALEPTRKALEAAK